MKLRLAGSAAILVAVAFVTVGCTPDPGLAADPIRTAEAAQPSHTPTPTPTPTPEVPTCENIVSEETISILESEGFVLIESHEEDLRAEGRIESKFFDLGGVDCVWGLAAGGDSMAVFGYSEIPDADAAEAQEWLGLNGYVRSQTGTDVVFEIDPENDLLGHGDIFLFEPGAWYHANFREPIEEIRQAVG